jgi:hypothetical protein
MRLTHRVLIPHVIAHAALHALNVAPFDVEGYGLNGFAFQCIACLELLTDDVLLGMSQLHLHTR